MDADPKQNSEAWLCLRFPLLALNCADQRFISSPSNLENSAIVVLDQQVVIQFNRLAQKSGIELGQDVNHARMLNSNLKVIERQPHLEAEKLDQLCLWAYRYTSHISVYNDHTLLLEIGRSLEFFSGLQSLQNRLLADVERLGLDCECGIAKTPKAAHLLSHHSQQPWSLSNTEQLIQQSAIAHLCISEKTQRQLHNCGFSLLSDIRQIPKAQLGTRFGKEFTTYLEQLLGDLADPQNLYCTPETFKACINFAEPIHNKTWIEQQIDRLLSDLVVFVNNRQLLCRRLVWRFVRESSTNTASLLPTTKLTKTVVVDLNISQINVKSLKELTDLKLSTLSLDWAFIRIELSSEELLPKHLFDQDLFTPVLDQSAFNQLISKISTRLGKKSVYTLETASEYLPELANSQRYFAANALAKDTQQQAVSEQSAEYIHTHQDEPLWLLERPQKLQQHQRVPLYQGPLDLVHGPNRITSHWWQHAQHRDYYIAKQTQGRLLWVYYERQQHNWYLHGLYA